MGEFKGTLGPWTAVDKRPHSDGFSVFSNDQYIAFVGDSDGATNCKDNANLIAAAPELLEALQVLKRELVLSDVDLAYIESHFRPHIDRARAAIAKALGQ